MPKIGFGTSIGRIGRRRIEPQHPRLGLIAIAVTLVGGSGVVFDVLTRGHCRPPVLFGAVLVGLLASPAEGTACACIGRDAAQHHWILAIGP
jgi:hypothetical protein